MAKVVNQFVEEYNGAAVTNRTEVVRRISDSFDAANLAQCKQSSWRCCNKNQSKSNCPVGYYIGRNVQQPSAVKPDAVSTSVTSVAAPATDARAQVAATSVRNSSVPAVVVAAAEQPRCILDAASPVDQKGRCNMSTKSRHVSALFFPYVGKYMRMISARTVEYNIGDLLCSIHYNEVKRLRNDDIAGMQLQNEEDSTEKATSGRRKGADKKKTSLVEYFQSCRPDESSTTEEGSALQQLNLLIHASLCAELMRCGFVKVSKAKDVIKQLCLKHVESTSNDAIRKRAERLLYDPQSNTSLLSFLHDVSFVKVPYEASLFGSQTSGAVDPERSYMRYDGFKAGPESSSFSAKMISDPSVRRQVFSYCQRSFCNFLFNYVNVLITSWVKPLREARRTKTQSSSKKRKDSTTLSPLLLLI